MEDEKLSNIVINFTITNGYFCNCKGKTLTISKKNSFSEIQRTFIFKKNIAELIVDVVSDNCDSFFVLTRVLNNNKNNTLYYVYICKGNNKINFFEFYSLRVKNFFYEKNLYISTFEKIYIFSGGKYKTVNCTPEKMKLFGYKLYCVSYFDFYIVKNNNIKKLFSVDNLILDFVVLGNIVTLYTDKKILRIDINSGETVSSFNIENCKCYKGYFSNCGNYIFLDSLLKIQVIKISENKILEKYVIDKFPLFLIKDNLFYYLEDFKELKSIDLENTELKIFCRSSIDKNYSASSRFFSSQLFDRNLISVIGYFLESANDRIKLIST